ncbi:DNA repair protein RadC [Patescibacteria group bacterium]|nr:DNA repair protein RadC [Patescibacteria group bacterium]
MKIKDLQNEEKPREKLIQMGPENLTDTELLAIILRSGGKETSATNLARQLLDKFEGLKALLSADIKELIEVKNIDIAKASSIKAVEEISKRYLYSPKQKEVFIKTPGDVYKLIRKDILNKDHELLFLITLDNRNKLISKDVISKGTINETLIHPREIFKKALAKNACSIILAHNHPSDNPDPSGEDIKVTRRIFKAGVEMGIPLTDHLIVSNDSFTSMKAQNLISL